MAALKVGGGGAHLVKGGDGCGKVGAELADLELGGAELAAHLVNRCGSALGVNEGCNERREVNGRCRWGCRLGGRFVAGCRFVGGNGNRRLPWLPRRARHAVQRLTILAFALDAVMLCAMP